MKVSFKSLVFGLMLTGFVASAQKKCDEAFTELKDEYAAGAYDEAMTKLNGLVKDCPKYSIEVYGMGDKMLRYKYESSRTDQDKGAVATELVKLYNDQKTNFPASDADIKKALFLSETKKADDKEVFKVLDNAFATNTALFTDYRALELYFNLYLKQYEAKAEGVNMDSFIKKYGEIATQTAAAQAQVKEKRDTLQKKSEDGETLKPEEKAFLENTKNDTDALAAVADNMAKQVSGIFSCEKLEGYYGTNYDANKDNIAWIKGMVTSLKALRCNKSSLLIRGLDAVYKAKPDYDAVYDMAYYAQKRGDAAAAARYYEEAAAKQPSAVKRGALYMDVASLYRNTDKAKAKEFALKAAQANNKLGAPYLLIAEMYMSAGGKECNLSDFDKKALTFAALDELKKAEAAEPKYKATVQSLQEQYSKSIPTKKEAKDAKKRKGDVVTFGCWINTTVTLPKLK